MYHDSLNIECSPGAHDLKTWSPLRQVVLEIWEVLKILGLASI